MRITIELKDKFIRDPKLLAEACLEAAEYLNFLDVLVDLRGKRIKIEKKDSPNRSCTN